ncbi:MAG TPA: SGNH/GDSL hydrolase family protein [Acidimicrobiales bacterium]|nr:SGNH/GDSL hydrolase family protein [Acidimicrobiales bacterium]
MAFPRIARALAGTVLLVSGLAGCGLFDRDAGDRVLVVGDSVTYQSRAYLVKEFAWADELDIEATSGLRTDQLLPDAEEGLSHHPSSAAFMPGYNDILQDRVDRAALPEMMDLAAKVPCSVWLLIPVKGVYAPATAEAWNQRVRDEAAGHDNVHLVDDWARLVDNSQDYALVKSEDAVHPNGLGRKAVADVMSKSIQRECGA